MTNEEFDEIMSDENIPSLNFISKYEHKGAKSPEFVVYIGMKDIINTYDCRKKYREMYKREDVLNYARKWGKAKLEEYEKTLVKRKVK